MMWNRISRVSLCSRTANAAASFQAALALAWTLGWGIPSAAPIAPDSLYRECDTVPRGGSPRYASIRVEEDPGCASTVPCGPEQAASRNLPDGGVEAYHFRMRGRDTIRDGTFEIRDQAKRIRKQGRFAAGKRSGEWIAWYPNGKRRSVENYREGMLEGLHREYSPKGRLLDEFKYRDGALDCADGYHRSWYHNGKLKFEMQVRDRKLARYVFFDSLGKELDLPVLLNP
jgi:MORN repeat protein